MTNKSEKPIQILVNGKQASIKAIAGLPWQLKKV